MMRILTLVSLLLFAAGGVDAQDRGIALRLRGKSELETLPNKVVTLVSAVANATAEERTLEADTALPEGWTLITGDRPLVLAPEASGVNLISFHVPATALAGEYEITQVVRDAADPQLRDSWTISLRVLPVRRLRLQALNVPPALIAGEAHSARVLIVNEGNVTMEVGIQATSDETLPATLTPDRVRLEPQGAGMFQVALRADPKVRNRHHARLTLTARSPADAAALEQLTSYVEIIPRIASAEDRFHRFPLRASVSAPITRIGQESQAGVQFELTGEGTFTEKSPHTFGLLLRGPDLRRSTMYGSRAEGRLWLEGPRYSLQLGDGSHDASSLTGGSRYGRGVQAAVQRGHVELGAVYQRAHWLATPQDRLAGHLRYGEDDDRHLRLNLLHEAQGSRRVQLVSLNGVTRPGWHPVRLEWELALGGGDYAYLLNAQGRYRRLSYVLRALHAEPGYPGYYDDTDFLSAGASLPLARRWTFGVGFQQSQDNLDLDPRRFAARQERRYRSHINWDFASRGTLGVEYTMARAEDRLPDPRFDTDEHAARLRARYGFSWIAFTGSYGYEWASDQRSQARSEDHAASLATSITPMPGHSYGIYADYRETHSVSPTLPDYYPRDLRVDESGGLNERSLSGGLHGMMPLGARTDVRFRAHSSRYRYLGLDIRRTSVEMWFRHRFSNKHELNLNGRHSFAGNWRMTDLSLNYTAPFGVPVARRKDIGAIEGRVFDSETGDPLANVILRLDGLTAVTDEAGEFAFPYLKPGSYYLMLNASRIGLGLVTTEKEPFEMTVEDGVTTTIEIGVIRSAILDGRVQLYRFDEPEGSLSLRMRGKAAKLVPSHGLAGAVLELASDTEAHRRVTDAEGRFRFDELRPGRWTLKLYKRSVPEFHHVEQEVHEFELEPGVSEEVTVKVLPRRRQIQIIERGGVIEE